MANRGLNISEQAVRIAMRYTRSNIQAARLLGVSYNTYKKYASKYIDPVSGKSLFELHKNPSRYINRPDAYRRKILEKFSLNDIFSGKHRHIPPDIIRDILVAEGIKEEKCDMCNFSERRVTDYKVPLVLIWKDGDMQNHALENLEYLCYNCFFLYEGDLVFKRINPKSKRTYLSRFFVLLNEPE